MYNAATDLPKSRLAQVIEILETVGLEAGDPFGFRGQVLRHDFGQRPFVYDAQDAGTRITGTLTALDGVSFYVSVTPGRTVSDDLVEEIDYANEDLTDI